MCVCCVFVCCVCVCVCVCCVAKTHKTHKTHKQTNKRDTNDTNDTNTTQHKHTHTPQLILNGRPIVRYPPQSVIDDDHPSSTLILLNAASVCLSVCHAGTRAHACVGIYRVPVACRWRRCVRLWARGPCVSRLCAWAICGAWAFVRACVCVTRL